MMHRPECEAYLELISLSLDETLEEEQRAALDAHGAACPECRALQEDLAALSKIWDGEALAPLPEGLHDRIMDAVRGEAAPASRRPQAWRRWSALAAMVALVVAVGFFGKYLLPDMGGSAKLSGAGSAAPVTPSAPSAAPGDAMDAAPEEFSMNIYSSAQSENATADDKASGGVAEPGAGENLYGAPPPSAPPAVYYAILTVDRLPEDFTPPDSVAGKNLLLPEDAQELLLTVPEFEALLVKLDRAEIDYQLDPADEAGDTVLVCVVPGG